MPGNSKANILPPQESVTYGQTNGALVALATIELFSLSNKATRELTF